MGLEFVALSMYAHRIPFFPVDVTITRHIQGVQAAWFGPLLEPLNVLGFPPLVGIVYGTVALIILAAGARWEAVVLGFAVLGSSGLNHLSKALVARPRPPIDLIHVAHRLAGTGFPAGHVLNYTVFAGLSCYLACARLTPSWPRTALIAFLLVTMALMGVARIYAGEHWPSDVLGGYLLGIVWLAAMIALYRWGIRRGRNRDREHAKDPHEAGAEA